MKRISYIEQVINEPVSDEIKDVFFSQLINDPELRREYQRYIILNEEVKKQEDEIREIVQELTGYTFDVNLASITADTTQYFDSSNQILEDSRLIRSVIDANRPSNTRERKGWCRAAIVLTLLMLIIISSIIDNLISSNTIKKQDVYLGRDFEVSNPN